jgi:hypothetical protein
MLKTIFVPRVFQKYFINKRGLQQNFGNPWNRHKSMCWTTVESGFDSGQKQKISLFQNVQTYSSLVADAAME